MNAEQPRNPHKDSQPPEEPVLRAPDPGNTEHADTLLPAISAKTCRRPTAQLVGHLFSGASKGMRE